MKALVAARIILAVFVMGLAAPPGLLAQGATERDPFRYGSDEKRPPAGRNSPESFAVVEMVLISGGRRIVVINGERLGEGGVVKGYAIEKITLESVTLGKNGERKIIGID